MAQKFAKFLAAENVANLPAAESFWPGPKRVLYAPGCNMACGNLDGCGHTDIILGVRKVPVEFSISSCNVLIN